MKWLELAKTFDPALAERAQVSLDEVQRAVDAFKAAQLARDAVAREVEAAVEAHQRVATLPPVPDASELVPLLGLTAIRGAVYRVSWNGRMAYLDAFTFDHHRMQWVPAWAGFNACLSPKGVPKYKRKPVVTPERLAELCGGPCP